MVNPPPLKNSTWLLKAPRCVGLKIICQHSYHHRAGRGKTTTPPQGLSGCETLDQMRIDVQAEDEIDRIRGVEGIQFDLNPIFKVEIS